MSDTLSPRDQLARDIYVQYPDARESAFTVADAFMAERARRTPVAAVADTARTPAVDTVCGDNRNYLAPVAAVADTARAEVISNGTAAPASACDENCVGTCNKHIDGYGYRRLHAKDPSCPEWQCSHGGSAHAANTSVAPLPAAVAPVVLTSDERAAVGCINREFWWGDALCTLLKRLGVEVKL